MVLSIISMHLIHILTDYFEAELADVSGSRKIHLILTKVSRQPERLPVSYFYLARFYRGVARMKTFLGRRFSLALIPRKAL